MDKLIIDFLDLLKKMLLNMIGWGVGITWMGEVFIPWEYGLEVISHTNPISYGKYVFKFFFFF